MPDGMFLRFMKIFVNKMDMPYFGDQYLKPERGNLFSL